jgi:two-component system sensor kinase
MNFFSKTFLKSSSFKMTLIYAVLLFCLVVFKMFLSFDLGDASLNRAIFWSGIVVIILVLLLSFVIGVFVVREVAKISKTAREIVVTGDLSKRIPVSSNWDDLSKLTLVLNEVFGDLEFMVESVKKVSDNIAHDLKTPITRLKNKVEKVQDVEVKEGLLLEIDAILSIFNSLLRIASIESEHKKSAFKDLRLERIIDDAISYYEPLAIQKNIKIQLDLQDVSFFGDKDLLFQAFSNVIDNAIKYSRENSEIRINLSENNGNVLVKISDSGIGIEEKDKDKIFQRFYRADKSRATKGHGLGLAFVRAVVKLHGGAITLSDNKPGLVFEIKF